MWVSFHMWLFTVSICGVLMIYLVFFFCFFFVFVFNSVIHCLCAFVGVGERTTMVVLN